MLESDSLIVEVCRSGGILKVKLSRINALLLPLGLASCSLMSSVSPGTPGPPGTSGPMGPGDPPPQDYYRVTKVIAPDTAKVGESFTIDFVYIGKDCGFAQASPIGSNLYSCFPPEGSTHGSEVSYGVWRFPNPKPSKFDLGTCQGEGITSVCFTPTASGTLKISALKATASATIEIRP